MDHLLNPPPRAGHTSCGVHAADGKWMYQGTSIVPWYIHCTKDGLVLSPSSAQAAHLPKGQMPLGIAPWQVDGSRRREKEKEMLHDSGIGRSADGRGTSVCSSQALAGNQGPGSHGSSSLAPADPGLAALCKEQNLQHHLQCLPSPTHRVSKAVQIFLRERAHAASQPEWLSMVLGSCVRCRSWRKWSLHRALVTYAVKLSCWTSKTGSGSVIQITCLALLVSPVTQNSKVLVLQKILKITNGAVEFFP